MIGEPFPYPSRGPSSISGLGAGAERGYPALQGLPELPSPDGSSAAPGGGASGAAPLGGAGSAPTGAAAAGAPGSAFASDLGGVGSAAPSAFGMIGDMSPPMAFFPKASGPPGIPNGNRPPPPPPPGTRSLLAPSVRGFKISENQSPMPQDRVFFSFNGYNDVNKQLNNAFESPLKSIHIYRYVWGFEKTFNDGLGSFGVRLPLNSVYAKSREPSLNTGGNSTALGDLTLFLKHILYVDRATGSLASAGVAVTPRTAPRQFGGASFLAGNNTTSLQPFFAFFVNRDKLYFQGFSAIDVPIDAAQPTMFYNDFAVGYYLYRDLASQGLITAIAPTAEVHVNTPLNHRGAYDPFDPNGTPDIVNLTSGLNVGLMQRSNMTFGVVVPVTGPRPFDIEATFLLNVYFGRSRRAPAPPVIGG